MSDESVKEYYDRQYASDGGLALGVHDLAKAERRFSAITKAFNIDRSTKGAEILDVGSGLGYYTKALASLGARVTGIDFSETAVIAARKNFPECKFVQAAWPDGVATSQQFDVIWMVNFSLMNTFDVNFIGERLISEALSRLKSGGFLVIGWNTDFSGRTRNGYSHWSISMLTAMRKTLHLSAPIVPEVPVKWISWLLIRVACVFRRSIPVFMVRQKLS